MCSVPTERDVSSGVMYASQVMCASRVESGTHLITATAGRSITFALAAKHHLRYRRKHHFTIFLEYGIMETINHG